MPSIEDVFDDDSDLPLPSAPSRALRNTGSHGALLEEIQDADDFDMDMGLLATQSAGQGDRLTSPLPSSSRSRPTPAAGDELRPVAEGKKKEGPIGPNLLAAMGGGANPMAGMMGDLMKIQEAEDEKMRRLEKQMGGMGIRGGVQGGKSPEPEVYKLWSTLYPIYFDAKLPSSSPHRRVPRSKALWWPQSWMIARVCGGLGLDCVHEMDKTHPADWRNPGRVKVSYQRPDGRYNNPIIKTRAQLLNIVALQMQSLTPALASTPEPVLRKKGMTTRQSLASASASSSTPKKSASKASSSTAKPLKPIRTRPLPPQPPLPLPKMDERYPLTSPALATGVAVSSMKRDVEAERKSGGGAGKKAIEEGGAGKDGKEKEPKMKMKRVMVRKR